jgi:hypothetical protein
MSLYKHTHSTFFLEREVPLVRYDNRGKFRRYSDGLRNGWPGFEFRQGQKICLNSTLSRVGGEWSASRPRRSTPGKRGPGTHWIGGWVGPRTGLNDVEKRKFLNVVRLELWPLGRLARSQSLYRLYYLGSLFHIVLRLGMYVALHPISLQAFKTWLSNTEILQVTQQFSKNGRIEDVGL